MEIGIDSFALKPADVNVSPSQALRELIERIEFADEVGLDFFGIGEHHRPEFLDSAPTMILAAAASRTKRIKLGSAVTVLSAADPVRVFQNFATLDLLSNGRAEIIAGRGSFIEAYPLFGLNLNDYDELFAEKLELLLKIRDEEVVNWQGRFRPALKGQGIYPRPLQKKLPIWLGVGGTPASFARAGQMGLPLMVAIIGGETHRFRPLIDLYRRAGMESGYDPDQLEVGIHSLGYIANTSEEAIDIYYPGYKVLFDNIGKERGYPPVTPDRFHAQNGPTGALLVGSPEEVATKIRRHSEALGGVSRFTFQMDAGLSHKQLLNAIELIGTRVKPLVDSK
jgi:probable LLM family oxidoreductase